MNYKKLKLDRLGIVAIHLIILFGTPFHSSAQEFGTTARWNNDSKLRQLHLYLFGNGSFKSVASEKSEETKTPVAGSLGVTLSYDVWRFSVVYGLFSTADSVVGKLPQTFGNALLNPEGFAKNCIKIDIQSLSITGGDGSSINVGTGGTAYLRGDGFHLGIFACPTTWWNLDSATSGQPASITKINLTWNPSLDIQNSSGTNKVFFGPEIGLTYRTLGDDITQDEQNTLREKMLGTNATKFFGAEIAFVLRFNSVKIFVETPYLWPSGDSRNVKGLTGFRYLAGASFDAGLEIF